MALGSIRSRLDVTSRSVAGSLLREFMIYFETYLKHLAQQFPVTGARADLKELWSPLLCSKYIIELPRSALLEAQALVEATFRWTRSSPKATQFQDWGHASALMSYDFHLTADGLRLIEINTNASMGIMGSLLYSSRGLKPEPVVDPIADIRSSFQHEWTTFARFASQRVNLAYQPRELRSIAIVDSKPQGQRAYLEFLLYQEAFGQCGWQARIADPSELRWDGKRLCFASDGLPVDLVYNRLTDFYLVEAENASIRQAAEAGAVCLTPNPREYELLADKRRMIDWSKDSLGVPAELRAALIPTTPVHEMDRDALWAARKRYFFKTEQSFGGKAAYRGDAISRGTFERILTGPYLAQELVPPGDLDVPDLEVGAKKSRYKFDIRFIAYRDRVQLAFVRLFQGQMTNSQTLGGGLTAIQWRDEGPVRAFQWLGPICPI